MGEGRRKNDNLRFKRRSRLRTCKEGAGLVMRTTLLALTIALGSLAHAGAQTSAPGLPRLDLFGSGGGPRKQLGLEGTPLAKEPKPEKKAKGQTEITALEATFDQKTREAVFIDNVVVIDPEFKLTTCDRLTAFL